MDVGQRDVRVGKIPFQMSGGAAVADGKVEDVAGSSIHLDRIVDPLEFIGLVA
jgi:hypothetical protein